jgi:hypothetical protein
MATTGSATCVGKKNNGAMFDNHYRQRAKIKFTISTLQ